MTDQEIFQKIDELKKRDIPVCLATIVYAAGSTPRESGAKMIICADGTTYGTVGGGCGESQVKTAALNCLLTTQKPETVEVSLLDDLGTKGGDVCGGRMLLFVEPM
jgi:xanthine dehydrogenase accessory factor